MSMRLDQHLDTQMSSYKWNLGLSMLRANEISYRGTLRLYDDHADKGIRKIHPLCLELFSHINPVELHSIGLNYY